MTGSPARARGFSRPVHAPFTAFPVAAYIFAAGFDVISAAGGARHGWAGQLWHAGTFVLVGGLALAVITLVTGFADLVRAAGARAAGGAGAAIAAHVTVVLVAVVGAAGDLAWRLSYRQHPPAATPAGIAGLSVAVAVVTIAGGYLGGKLVFGHGIGVAARADTGLPEAASVADHDRGAPGARGAPDWIWPGGQPGPDDPEADRSRRAG
jgi:uncharacterized membrane protein